LQIRIMNWPVLVLFGCRCAVVSVCMCSREAGYELAGQQL
jgi:hypothetical protein